MKRRIKGRATLTSVREHALAARVALASNAYRNHASRTNRGSYVTGFILHASIVNVSGRSLKVNMGKSLLFVDGKSSPLGKRPPRLS